MARRRLLQPIARAVERQLERIGAMPDAPPLLDAYKGYAEPGALVVRGRVLTGLRHSEPVPEQSRWTNLRQMAGLFLTDEVADVPVAVPGTHARGVSDAEGYVLLHVPAGDRAPGWHDLTLCLPDVPGSARAFPVLVPDPAARFGVISDIDDTMMETGAYSLARNLWTTFTGSALTRRVYPDSVALMTRLSAGGLNPVFYVSSSPWNLHAFLDSVFARAGLVTGPMFLRDLGPAEDKVLTGGHGSHKGAAIDRILAANPRLAFVLIGDTGQHDAMIYRDAVLRHEGRIAAVILREPVVGAGPKSLEAIAAIEAAGVPCHHAPDFTAIPEIAVPPRAGAAPG